MTVHVRWVADVPNVKDPKPLAVSRSVLNSVTFQLLNEDGDITYSPEMSASIEIVAEAIQDAIVVKSCPLPKKAEFSIDAKPSRPKVTAQLVNDLMFRTETTYGRAK